MEKQILFFDLLETFAEHAADVVYRYECSVVNLLDNLENLT